MSSSSLLINSSASTDALGTRGGGGGGGDMAALHKRKLSDASVSVPASAAATATPTSALAPPSGTGETANGHHHTTRSPSPASGSMEVGAQHKLDCGPLRDSHAGEEGEETKTAPRAHVVAPASVLVSAPSQSCADTTGEGDDAGRRMGDGNDGEKEEEGSRGSEALTVQRGPSPSIVYRNRSDSDAMSPSPMGMRVAVCVRARARDVRVVRAVRTLGSALLAAGLFPCSWVPGRVLYVCASALSFYYYDFCWICSCVSRRARVDRPTTRIILATCL